jgi:hypothetical protein
MHWLIQKKFLYDKKVVELIENLDRLGIQYSYCKVIPFTDDGIEFEDYEPPKDTPVFTTGSYTLAKIAKKYYSPASFISDDISINNLFNNYKDEMFNPDMKFGTIGDIKPQLDKFFIRPIHDTKSFTGQVMTLDELYKWQEKLQTLPDDEFSTVDLNTPVMYSSIKTIDFEVRFFIINSKVVTYSEYKRGDTVAYADIVEDYIVDYVKDIIKIWEPDAAYVLDVAVTDGVPKILEANCINAVGLYAIDTQKFIMAVEDLI